MPRRRMQGGSIAGIAGRVVHAVQSGINLGKRIKAAHDFVKSGRYISRGAKALAAIPGNPYASHIGNFANAAAARGYGRRKRRIGGRGASVANRGRMVPI